MFYLCTVRSKDLLDITGASSSITNATTKYPELKIILIAQSPDITKYLLFSNILVPEFTQEFSVPEGFDFIFRQEWGLVVTEDILHRVIDTLRKEEYPPIADYLDAKVKGDLQQEHEYISKCLAVKQKYPKFSF
jgi:hypothetical protein